MKKISIFLTITSIFFSIGASAEERDEEQVRDFGLKEGQWAVGVTLTPALNFIGNLFNGNTSNTLEPLTGTGLVNNFVSLSSRYMVSDKWAMRTNIGLILGIKADKAYVSDDYQRVVMGVPDAKVIDTRSTSSCGGSLSIIMERRFTSKRIQPILGIGAVYAFDTRTQSFDYGNAMTDINQSPTMKYSSIVSLPGYPAARVLKTSSNGAFYHTFGIVGEVGVEIFLIKQLSLGLEMTASALFTKEPMQYSVYEGYNLVSDKISQYTSLTSPGGIAFEFSTKTLGANLLMTFYF